MRKFIQHISWVCIPLLCIPLVNYFIDPAHMYDHYEQQIVSLLQEHKYVINVDPDKDERALMKAMIDSCERDIDVLILGSSRIMLLSEKMFGGKHILNVGVSGATYEDIAALLYHFLQKHKPPQTIILGIDPQHFNANIGDTRWKSIDKEYAAYSKEVLQENVSCGFNTEKWANLFSIPYFKESVRYYAKHRCSNEIRMKAVDCEIEAEDIETGSAIGYDGSLIYGREYEMLPLSTTNTKAKNETYQQWENYTELSAREIWRWEKLIQYIYIYEQDIKLYFYKAAFHPITYKRMMEEARYEGMRKGMEQIDKIAKENDIVLIGSYNPDDYHLRDSDFYDGMHMRRDAVERMLR